MGSTQIDIGILHTDEHFSVSPAYHTFNILDNDSKFIESSFAKNNEKYSKQHMIIGARQGKSVDFPNFLADSIYLPTINIQEKITSLLTDIENKIVEQENLVQKLKDTKSALLIKMFPQENCLVPELRFDGFTNDWEQRKLSDITFLAGERNRNNLPYESYSINNEQGFVPQNEQFEKGGSMAMANKSLYNIVSPKSFAYNPARINVGSIGYYDGSKNVIISSLYEVFKTVDDIDDRFLYHWFKAREFNSLIEKYQEGSVRLYFYYDKLCMCSLKVPHLEEQNKIAYTLDNLDKTITLHQRKPFHLNFSL